MLQLFISINIFMQLQFVLLIKVSDYIDNDVMCIYQTLSLPRFHLSGLRCCQQLFHYLI